MGDWRKAERYLRRISETDGITGNHLEGMLATAAVASSKFGQRSADTWERFRTGRTLSLAQKVHLEAVVLPNGLRPAFDIKEDNFPQLPEPWQGLNSHREFLRSCIVGVGRLNVPGHPFLDYAGTAFVVGENVLLTNRHVAEVFCQVGGSTVEFTPGISPCLDVKQEVDNTESVVLTVSKPVLLLPNWDAALFRLGSLPASLRALRLAGTPPAEASGRLATVVGYPGLDTRTTTEELLQQIQIFRAVFGKKRLQPGRLLGFHETSSYGQQTRALTHDCTTLGGNSGSALIDVEAEAIVGLHFGGDYLVANYAVPSWELAGCEELRDEGVLFS